MKPWHVLSFFQCFLHSQVCSQLPGAADAPRTGGESSAYEASAAIKDCEVPKRHLSLFKETRKEAIGEMALLLEQGGGADIACRGEALSSSACASVIGGLEGKIKCLAALVAADAGSDKKRRRGGFKDKKFVDAASALVQLFKENAVGLEALTEELQVPETNASRTGSKKGAREEALKKIKRLLKANKIRALFAGMRKLDKKTEKIVFIGNKIMRLFTVKKRVRRIVAKRKAARPHNGCGGAVEEADEDEYYEPWNRRAWLQKRLGEEAERQANKSIDMVCPSALFPDCSPEGTPRIEDWLNEEVALFLERVEEHYRRALETKNGVLQLCCTIVSSKAFSEDEQRILLENYGAGSDDIRCPAGRSSGDCRCCVFEATKEDFLRYAVEEAVYVHQMAAECSKAEMAEAERIFLVLGKKKAQKKRRAALRTAKAALGIAVGLPLLARRAVLGVAVLFRGMALLLKKRSGSKASSAYEDCEEEVLAAIDDYEDEEEEEGNRLGQWRRQRRQKIETRKNSDTLKTILRFTRKFLWRAATKAGALSQNKGSARLI